MSQVICLFNHKGGVSKTTTAFNLGWMLASKGKRVLMADFDPQCNLTGMVLGYRDIDDVSNLEGGTDPKNIKDGLAPAFESRPSLLKGVECIAVSGNDNLFLMPGHIGISEYEVTLGIAQELSGSLMTLRNLPGSLRYLIDKTAELCNADYVIVDMSPSLGPINQNLLMTSDYFIVPLHPDYFSSMGLDSLSSTIPKWRKWALSAQSIDALSEANYPFPKKDPKFLGSIIQKFRPRGELSPSRAFQKWINELNERQATKLIPALQNCGMLLPRETYEAVGFAPELPLLQMPDFNSLIAKSQEFRVPVYSLTDEQLNLGGDVLQNTKDSMNNFNTLISNAADKIIRMIEGATN